MWPEDDLIKGLSQEDSSGKIMCVGGTAKEQI